MMRLLYNPAPIHGEIPSGALGWWVRLPGESIDRDIRVRPGVVTDIDPAVWRELSSRSDIANLILSGELQYVA